MHPMLLVRTTTRLSATLRPTSSTSHLSTLQSTIPIIATVQPTSSSTMSTTSPTLRRLSPQTVWMSST
ncbi:unnamed protein product, partial [Adineta ricciae]